MTAEEEMYGELLGAYAVNAVDDDERRAIENYLRINPQAQREVDEHHFVASAMAWTSMEAPPGLWDRIAATLDGPAPAPSGQLAKVMPIDRRRRRLNTFAAAAIAVAAALVAVLAVGTWRTDRSSTVSMKAAMEQARRSPDARVGQLHSPDGAVAVDVVIDRDGHGFLAGNDLPGLPSDRTYQLWGVIDGEPISLGVLGHRPGVEPFSVAGNVTQVMVSNEVAGGVPTNANATGLLSANLG